MDHMEWEMKRRPVLVSRSRLAGVLPSVKSPSINIFPLENYDSSLNRSSFKKVLVECT
jgi:hypothetical protein